MIKQLNMIDRFVLFRIELMLVHSIQLEIQKDTEIAYSSSFSLLQQCTRAH